MDTKLDLKADPLLERHRCMTEEQVADLLGHSVDSMARLRKSGKGPKWLRLSERKLGYRVGDVIDWLDRGGFVES